MGLVISYLCMPLRNTVYFTTVGCSPLTIIIFNTFEGALDHIVLFQVSNTAFETNK